MANHPLQLLGLRFGRLLVISREKTHRNGSYYWLCACDCGKQKTINGSSLKDGSTKSCGCFRDENAGTYNIRHGQYRSLTHSTWRSMRNRCLNPKNPSYKWYGARGITVCERWAKFENFLADMGERPLGPTYFSLDRINNNGNYEPGNCRWATDLQQRANRRPVDPAKRRVEMSWGASLGLY
jgi:hypothetical protein